MSWRHRDAKTEAREVRSMRRFVGVPRMPYADMHIDIEAQSRRGTAFVLISDHTGPLIGLLVSLDALDYMSAQGATVRRHDG